MTKHYTYIFTRQDISPEQQAVQSAHVTHCLGYELDETHIHPNQTYFTLVGVRDLEALEAAQQILIRFGFRYVKFYEPDLGNELTSIATFPIPERERGPLLAFNLLKM